MLWAQSSSPSALDENKFCPEHEWELYRHLQWACSFRLGAQPLGGSSMAEITLGKIILHSSLALNEGWGGFCLGLERVLNLTSYVHIIFLMLFLDRMQWCVALWSPNGLHVPCQGKHSQPCSKPAQLSGRLWGNTSWHHALNPAAVICSAVTEETLGSWLAPAEAEAISSVSAPQAK